MSLRALDQSEAVHITSELRSTRDASVPAPFGEVALADMSSSNPRGLAVGEWAEDRWVMISYAVPNPDGDTWTMEISLDSGREDAEAMVEASAAHFASRGVSDLAVWIHDPRLSVGGLQFHLERSLHRMRLDLPTDRRADWPEGIRVTGFRIDQDESNWLGLNNKAFVGHQEQSAWTVEDFRRTAGTQWFDPEGLRMAWKADRLVAFNWTKVLVAEDRVVEGEIYVIAVDPDFHGLGLGRAATIEGLNDMHERQGARRATLYVDAANKPGMRLYEGLGFTSIEIHRAFRYRPQA